MCPTECRKGITKVKIYTRIVIDMASGHTLEADSFDYAGPVALCKDGGSPPAAPTPIDPWEVIRAQTSGNPDIKTPFYSRKYLGDPKKGNYRVVEDFDPRVMKQFDSRNQIANAMLSGFK